VTSTTYAHTYEHPVTGQYGVNQCDTGKGLCTSDCRNDCCDARCTSKYPKSGVGYCVQDYGLNYCSCTYRRRWVCSWLKQNTINKYMIYIPDSN